MTAPDTSLRMLVAITSGLLCTAAIAKGAPDKALTLEVSSPPVSAIIEGARVLRYEVQLRNAANEPIRLQNMTVRHADTGAAIAELGGAALTSATGRHASGRGGDDPLLIEPGANAQIYLDIQATNARRLVHHVSYARGSHSVTTEAEPIRVDDRPRLRLTPPLASGTYVAVYDPAMAGGHRRYFYATGGVNRVPGRFAIDWFPVAGGPGVGSSVVAVADATVVVAADEDTGPEGVHVVLDLGRGRFAHYEHLLPGLQVRAGQRVRRGAPLGRLGATGQVTGPHLHFHVSDGPTSTGWEGRPYLLDGATVVGGYASIASAVEGGAWTPRGRRPLQGLPAPNAVVEFARTNHHAGTER